jgi:hypothetical protein
MSWQGIFAAVLIVLAIFVARQMANARPHHYPQKTITEPVRHLCCRPICRPAACPTVRVRWWRPDRWCPPRWCRPWPRRHCDGWYEARWERPPFWDDRW